MRKVNDWEGLLDSLQAEHRQALDGALRKALQRRLQLLARSSARSLPITDTVRSQAVATWRKRHMRGASKNAKRRMGYPRLQSNPTYQQIERELAREYWRKALERLPRTEEVGGLPLAKACAAFRATCPQFGSSGLEPAVRSILREVYAGAIDREAILAQTRDLIHETVRTRNLTEYAGAHLDGQEFNLYDVTTKEQAAARIRTTHLAERVVCRKHKLERADMALSALIAREVQTQPEMAALDALLGALYSAPHPQASIVRRRAKSDAKRIAACLDDDAFIQELVDDLLQNPLYAKQYEQSVELLLRVRERVPQTPMDAYPLARTMHRRFVVHVGPTNSGKTHDALHALAAAPSGTYLGPLRLLAYEQFERLNQAGCPCSLLTGEESVGVPGAHHVSSTVEMADYQTPVEVAVIDEAQMIAEPSRGHNWTNALLGIPATEVHICCAPHAERVVCQLARLCGDTCEIVRHERLVPLSCERSRFRLPEDAEPGDALVVFSRKSVHAVAATLRAAGLRPSLVYGALPYEVRHEEARKFDAGETDVIVATDAIGMGMNLPIRRIVFAEQEKFDGRERRMLRPEEVQQIAGRAGRYGRYGHGLFASTRQRASIARRYAEQVAPIESLPVGIPANIALVRDATLSQSVRQWMAIEQPEPFSRIGIARDLRLIAMAEAHVASERLTDIDTKLTVLALATMPFDERERRLMDAWRTMTCAQFAGETCELPLPQTELVAASLSQLEADYRYCDLLYTYERLFAGTAERMSRLITCRNDIAHAIMTVLDASHER